MAALCTWKRKRVAEFYPFDRFAERALFLESLVRPGGLLVIHGATYRFGDTVHKCAYETIPVTASQETKVYLPDGVTPAVREGCIFRKLKPDALASRRQKVRLFAEASPRLPQQVAA
jgi:hypothetical protein